MKSRFLAAIAVGVVFASATDLLLLNTAAAQNKTVTSAAPAEKITDPQALMRLGDLYYDGDVVAQDFTKAFDYYRQAAEAGSATSRLRMGEMLILGLGVPQDIEGGRAILEDAAKGGSIPALLSLGRVFSRGERVPMEPKLAIQAYQKAVSKGNVQAMMELGYIYSNGRFGPREFNKAAGLFSRAAEAGNSSGQLALGRLLLDGGGRRKQGDPAKGLRVLEEAGSAGVEEAVVAIANAYFYGIGVKQDVRLALRTLTAAAKRGNIPAALALVAAYRDGKKDGRRVLVKRDINRARSLLAEIAPKIEPSDAAVEKFLIDSSAASPKQYPTLYSRLRKLPQSERSSVIRELRRVNPNLYVFSAQTRLKESDAFEGNATGMLDLSSSRAFRRYCMKTAVPYFCNTGPMSGQTAEVLSYVF